MRKVINKLNKYVVDTTLNLFIVIVIIGMCIFLHFMREVIGNPESWGIDNILDALSIFLAIIGGIFAYKQWSFSNKTRRTELINQIVEKLRFDKEMAETMYAIDYGMLWYDESFHNSNTDFEYKVDELLSFLDYICYLKHEKHLTESEFRILQYEITRVCSSVQVQSYLWNLYHFSDAQGTTCSFQDLIDYGIDKKIIKRDIFEDKDIDYYPKYLNF